MSDPNEAMKAGLGSAILSWLDPSGAASKAFQQAHSKAQQNQHPKEPRQQVPLTTPFNPDPNQGVGVPLNAPAGYVTSPPQAPQNVAPTGLVPPPGGSVLVNDSGQPVGASPNPAPQVPGVTSAVPAPVPLNGAGWHQWKSWQDGDDVKGTGIATVFGGGNDPEDNSTGYWNNPIGPHTLGVSLPTGRVIGTRGSPFPQVPQGTMVKVYNRRTGKSVIVPVVDEGPTLNDQAGTGTNGSAMVDLTTATAQALGTDPDGSDPVDIRIIGGSKYLTPENLASPPPDPTHVDPGDTPILHQIQDAMHAAPQKNGTFNVDPIRELLGQLRSGAVQSILPRLDAHLDLAENAEKTNPQLSRTEFNRAQNLYNQMLTTYQNTMAARTEAMLAGRR